MAFEKLASIWDKGQPSETQMPILIPFGRTHVRVENPNILVHGFIHFPERNIRVAEAKGLTPISLRKIVDQLGFENTPYMAATDASPNGMLPGHFLSMEGINLDTPCISLRFCGTFGNRQVDATLETTPDMHMFTGAVVFDYRKPDGQRARLSEVAKIIEKGDEEYELSAEEKYFSDETGRLVLQS